MFVRENTVSRFFTISPTDKLQIYTQHTIGDGLYILLRFSTGWTHHKSAIFVSLFIVELRGSAAATWKFDDFILKIKTRK